MSYHDDEFYRSQEWRAIREMKLTEVGDECEEDDFWCGGPMHVHHLTYDRFGGREHMADLRVLCQIHHEEVHKRGFDDTQPRRYNDRLRRYQDERYEQLIQKHNGRTSQSST